MEQTIDFEKPKQKIYKERAIWVGSFIGGPLTAGYLIAENFKAFNKLEKARKTWIFTWIATALIIFLVFIIPENIKIPNNIIPIIYAAIAYYLVLFFQKKDIKKHRKSDGPLHSWWRTISISIIGLLLTLIPILGFAFLYDTATIDSSISTKTYGIKNHEITFDKNNISENEVNKIANSLTSTLFFDQSSTKYVYVGKVEDEYNLYILVFDGIKEDKKTIELFTQFRNDLQTYFPKKKIILNLAVDNIDNIAKRIE